MSEFEQDRAQGIVDLFATAEQQRRFASRRIVMAVSEPDAGSDVAAITAKAVRDGDEFVIDGEKKYIVGVGDAEYLGVVVRTGRDGEAHRQFSTILVPANAGGIEVQPILDMLGRHRSDKVFFTGVRVPVANLLGEEGRGWHQHAAVGDATATTILGERAAGSMRRLLDRAKDGELVPGHRQRVAADAIRAAVATGTGSMQLEAGAAITHLFAAETVQQLASTEFRLAGTAGLMHECNGETGAMNAAVDAAYATVEFGTAEVLRNEIAQSLGLG